MKKENTKKRKYKEKKIQRKENIFFLFVVNKRIERIVFFLNYFFKKVTLI